MIEKNTSKLNTSKNNIGTKNTIGTGLRVLQASRGVWKVLRVMLLASVRVWRFQEYVSEGISHPVFYDDLVYKLIRSKAQRISKIIKRLRHRKYDQVIIERTSPVGTRGLKSRMCPPYPHACRKRRLKWGAVI